MCFELQERYSLGDWECEPQKQDELECEVKWEPVDWANGALDDGQERKHNPIL